MLIFLNIAQIFLKNNVKIKQVFLFLSLTFSAVNILILFLALVKQFFVYC
jgi:hypothetical protein